MRLYKIISLYHFLENSTIKTLILSVGIDITYTWYFLEAEIWSMPVIHEAALNISTFCQTYFFIRRPCIMVKFVGIHP